MAEAWYTERGIPCSFRLTPMATPVGLDSTLDAAGYIHQDSTSVQTMNLDGKYFAADDRIEFSDHPKATWFDTILDSSRYMAGRRSTLEQSLSTIKPPSAFAILWENEQPTCTGLAVADGDLIGLFSIATRPGSRRSGLGKVMSETLLDWGQRNHGSSVAYLQVMHVNSAALELYRQMGFEPLYDYWYRSRVPRPPMEF